MKSLFWEGALIRGRSPHAAAGLPAHPCEAAGSPMRHSAAQPKPGIDIDKPGPPQPWSLQ